MFSVLDNMDHQMAPGLALTLFSMWCQEFADFTLFGNRHSQMMKMEYLNSVLLFKTLVHISDMVSLKNIICQYFLLMSKSIL